MRVIQDKRWVWLALGAVLALIIAQARDWPPPITAASFAQARLDTALPAPQGEQRLEQSFYTPHRGLYEIEFIAVEHGRSDEICAGQLWIELRDAQGTLWAQRSWQSGEVAHNETIRLSFDPLPQTGTYQLQLRGNRCNHLSVWGYSYDLFDSAQLRLTGLTSAAQILHFSSRYQLSWAAALGQLRRAAADYGGLICALLLIITAPGAALVTALPRLAAHPALRGGLALALGLALWPLGWLWWSLAGGRLDGWLLWLVVAGCWGWWGGQRWRKPPAQTAAQWRETLALGLFWLGTLAVRLLAVRDLAFLPWVDASRHGLITAVMVQQRQFITQYEPLLPVTRSLYHVGFHTLPATLQLMTGSFWPLETVLLVTMQLFSSLLPLLVYVGWRLWTGRGRGAWLAAFLTAVPFFFPAYYTSWGRLTQLTGLLLLPLVAALTWRCAGLTGSRSKGAWLGLALLAAGLFLIHFRVFLFYLPLAALILLVGLGRRANIAPLLGAGALSLLLVAPRIAQLVALNGQPLWSGDGRVAEFPTGYVTTGWERYFWYAAGGGLLILVAVVLWGRMARAAPPLTLAAWLGLLFLLTAGPLVGQPSLLPRTDFNSTYIAFFLPQALFLGWVGAWFRRWAGVAHIAGGLALGAGATALLLFGLQQQLTILNETTILAQREDRAALAWLAAHAPPTAKVGVSSWLWLNGAWAGSDAGAWITPLTGRATTTPPVDYIYEVALIEQVKAFNEAAEAIADWSTPAAADWLRQQGVTHLFIGRRGGYLDPAQLAHNPALRLEFQQEGTAVFVLDAPAP